MDEPERVRCRRADPDGQRRGRGAPALGAEGRARRREPRPGRPVCRVQRRSPAARSTRRATRSTPARSRRTRRAWRCCAWRRPNTATTSTRARSPRSGAPAASSARRCSATSARRSRATRTLVNLLLDESFRDAIGDRRVQDGWRFVVQTAVGLGIPVPALCASRSPTTTAYRSARLPANLTQAQRDFFGAHTYRRVDRDGVFHTNWTSDQFMTPARCRFPTAGCPRLPFARRARPSARPGRRAVPQGAHLRHSRERRRVQHRRQPRRLLRPAHRRSPPRWSTTPSAI